MSESKFAGLDWDEVEVGQELPEVSLDVTYDIVAGHIAGTRDWFPGHHDPEYARKQGQETIYANTMFFQGFLERVALEWAGPAWFVTDRTLRIAGSVYPGDTLVGFGVVESKEQRNSDLHSVRLAVKARARTDRPVLLASLEIAMTGASRAWWAAQ